MWKYKYTIKEINELLKTLVIVIDTREKENTHILKYFKSKDIAYKYEALETGDYGIILPKNETFEIKRDIYFDGRVERKAHIDEITGNLLRDKKTAFENELIRSQSIPFTLIVEDADGYNKMIHEEYRSKISAKALLGQINAMKARYNFEIVYLDKNLSGNWIYHHLYFQAREYLKNCNF